MLTSNLLHHETDSSPEPDDEYLHLSIKSLSGMLPPVVIHSHATLLDLKKQLISTESVPVGHRLRFFLTVCDGESITELTHDSRSLSSYGVVDGSELSLVIETLEPFHEESIDELLHFHKVGNVKLMHDYISKHSGQLISNKYSHSPMFFWQIASCPTQSIVELDISISSRISLENLQSCKNFKSLKNMTLLESLHLTFIDLGCVDACSLKTLSCAFGQLRRLRILKLAFCDSTLPLPASLLAPSFSKMKSLTSLSLSQCRMLPSEFSALASALLCMSLTSLNLVQCDLGNDNCQKLQFVLPRLVDLATLNLSENGVTDGWLSLSTSFSQMASLSSLNLSGNRCAHECCSNLMLHLETIPTLTLLELDGCHSGTCESISKPLPNLAFLSIQWIERMNCGLLALALASKFPSLTSLEMKISFRTKSSQESTQGPDKIIDAIADLSRLTSLKFHASGDYLKLIEFKELARALSRMQSLTELHLDSKLLFNYYRDFGSPTFEPVFPLPLSTLTSLRSLTLQNGISSIAGFRKFASDLVCFSSTLTVLNLDRNSFASGYDVFLNIVIPTLSQMISLTSLSLQFNRIHSVDCLVLASSLSLNSSLTDLDLSRNPIDNISVLMALLKSTSLRKLVLKNTCIRDSDEELLRTNRAQANIPTRLIFN